MSRTITTPNSIIGFLPDGKPVYEIRGGAPAPDEDPAPPADPADPPAEDPPAEGGEDEGLDEKTKAQLAKLRGEAAGWRTQLRDAQAALAAAKTLEEFQAAQADFESKIAAKDAELYSTRRDVVIASNKLPKELADLLPTEGKTIEELETLAKGLAKYAQSDDDEDDTGAGGLNPGSSGRSATDPASLAKQVAGSRPRFR